MYLSRLILNPRSRQVQREIADAYQMHRTILRAFAATLPDASERVLFRLEIDPRSGVPVVLVQSQTPPDWNWLTAPESTYLLHEVPDNPAVKTFDLKLSADQVLSFRLRANPTIKKSAADKENNNGKRLGLFREEDQTAWLERKLLSAGCSVLQVRVSGQDQVNGWRSSDDQPRKLTFHSVQFDGLLRVDDPDRLMKAIIRGIGSAKGFGFGLLSLARPA
ncbi:MAG TPA: type I-E CRISPR-associated protein Cas6/Cse3/CasE [Anaerolineaceae bacterium]|nr:type I-E CRISPR-associated protein Cas6/Cse3/CasE [Anaerolineaceae bacterium]